MEDDNSKSNNQCTSQLVSVSRLAKTPDKNLIRLSSQNMILLADSEVKVIKKNEMSFNKYNKQDDNLYSNKNLINSNSLNNNSNKGKNSKPKDFNITELDQCEVQSIKSNDIRRKQSISMSNYNMCLSYKEVMKDDENSFQLNDNNMIRMNNSLFEEVKNNSVNKSLQNGKNIL
jgi:hypothetical protein